MVVKVYISEYSGNFEVKKRQQRVETVLEAVGVQHQLVDVCAPEHHQQRLFMQETARPAAGERCPLPPQIYNEQHYCGDFYDFDHANETGQLLQFLRLEEGEAELPAREAPTTSAEPCPASRPAPVEVPEPPPEPPAPPPPLEPEPGPEPELHPPQAPEEPGQVYKPGEENLNIDKEA